jgi:predicted extracellular nuclease
MRKSFRVAALALLAATVTAPHVLRATGSANVVISEFRTRGPLGGNDEFIEIYNKSAAPVAIGGWKINGSNNAGTTSTRVTIAVGTMLNAGCHYLVANSSSSGYSGSVAADQTYGTGVTDDGGIGLLTSANVVVDQVGMSAGSAYKEGTTLAAFGGTNSDRAYERRPGGAQGSGTDTDVNSADFRMVAPGNPQNSTSPCIDVNGPTGVGTATPSAVAAGSTSLLTVAVTKGGGAPNTITSVVANLSSIGGDAAQAFFDDGSHGDVTAGDLTYSFFATVAAATTEGGKSLPVTITDSLSRTGAANIALTVQAPPPPLVEIHTIQGAGNTSPYVGQKVTTEGIVTAQRFNNGFFLQQPDAQADADPATSEGLFVFTGASIPAAAAVGNFVSVVGTVAEFVPSTDPFSPSQTELSGTVTVTMQSTGNPLPQPIALTAAEVNPAGAFDQMERFEGMRVAVASLTVTAPTQGTVNEASATATSSGVYYGVITGLDRPMREPGIEMPDPLPAVPCCIPRFDANPELLRVDSNGQVGYSATQTTEVMAGAVVTGIVGVVDYNSRAYTILPDVGAQGVVTNLHDAIAVTAPRADQFTIGTANIERFYDTVNDPDTSDVVLTPAAFATRLAKVSKEIRDIMRSPDIIGFEEVENLSTLQTIAATVNADTVANGGADPQYVAYLEEGNDIGGIDVGLLVKSSRVNVLEVQQYGKDEMYVNPLNHQPELLNDRPPLLLRATVHTGVYDDATITVIANHLRSLNGVDDPADGPRVRAKRLAQAEYLARLIQDRQSANAAEHIVAVGDYNAFEFNDGYVDVINTIRGDAPPDDQVLAASTAGDLVEPNLTDLVTLAASANRYSYVFAGSAQELDHVLVTQSTLAIVDDVQWGRVNADFPESFRASAARPERVSDHDPVVTYFRLLDQTPPAPPSLTVSRSALWPANHLMVDIDVTATTTDAVDPNPECSLVSATSNEPDNGLGDGDTTNDIVITGPLTVNLRAERSGTGSGRVYTLMAACQDHATPPNVSAPSTIAVTVPKRR